MGSRLESNSNAVRKRIENHTFDDEEGDEYGGSKFGGFSDYFRRKKIKLQNLDADLRSQSTDKHPIFRGVVAHVNGYTQPSLNDLHKMIVQHGGGFMQYLDGKTTVTHIIASSLTPKKAIEFKRYRIVKPAWVVDSIAAGKLLPWDKYRVLEEGAGQRVIGFDGGRVVSQANKLKTGYRDQTDASWYTGQFQSPTNSPRRASQFITSTAKRTTAEDIDEFVTGKDPARATEGHTPYIKPKAQRAFSPNESGLQSPELPALQMQEDDGAATDYEEDSVPSSSPPSPGAEVSRETPLTSDLQATEIRVRPTGGSAAPLRQPVMDPVDPPRGRLPKRPLDAAAEPPPKRTKPMTAEEHNAILLADPHVWKSSVVNPNFLEQYYRESRLHHLSTWKADLKSQLQALAQEKTSSQRAAQKRLPGQRRYILHVDFDSFFAAVSMSKHPQYKDKPAVVAHGQGTGSEIASANYAARSFGVKNGMWMKRALELCPDLKILPYDFPAYEEASRGFYDVILSVDGIVQSISVDEALVDVSALCIATSGSDGVKRNEGAIYREQSRADDIARDLRAQIKEKTGFDVSVGVGGNILLAKVALRKAKPAGQYQIKSEEILDFIGNLEVQDLPGVAWSIGGKLEDIGVKYVKDIREMTKERLISALGPKTGEKIWEYSRGIDRTEVGEQVIRKSVSAEVNWGVRFVTQEQVDDFIENLCGELNKRLLKEKVKGKQFTMKVMRRAADAPLDPPKHLGHGKCDTYNKSVVLGVATNAKEILTKEALSILKSFGFTPGELRGIGIQMTRLETLRAAGEAGVESSQRRLHFNARSAAKPIDDPIEDDPVTPQKPKDPPLSTHLIAQLKSSSPSRKPLNVQGTQFLLPTQVDPKVLAELPTDIRSKLLKSSRKPRDAAEEIEADPPSRGRSPAPRKPAPAPPRRPVAFTQPTLTQIDPAILAELPEDLRAEVLATYGGGPVQHPQVQHARTPGQTVLPGSPSKPRALPPPPAKRGRGRPRGALNRPKGGLFSRDKDAKSGLYQSNFIAPPKAAADVRAVTPAPELDPEFLAALPEDIRAEVLENNRREIQQRNNLLSLSKKPPPKPPLRAPTPESPSELIRPALERKKKKPTFAPSKLTSVRQLRKAINRWYKGFRVEGPYKEDVEALGKYLAKVVDDKQEGNMEKVRTVVKWFMWVVDEGKAQDEDVMVGEDDEQGGKHNEQAWVEAMGLVKEMVQVAVKKRGLGEMVFDD